MKTHDELVAEIKAMPGMNAVFVYAFSPKQKSHKIYSKSAIGWMLMNGLIDVMQYDKTEPGFLHQSRDYALVRLTKAGRDVTIELQKTENQR